MTKRKPLQIKAIKAYAGIVCGQIDKEEACDPYDGIGESHVQFSVFKTYKDARKRFQYVIPVWIRPFKGVKP